MNRLKFVMTKSELLVSISLIDFSGKILVEEEVKDSQTKINAQNFAEGIYFIKITTPYKTKNLKIIIQK